MVTYNNKKRRIHMKIERMNKGQWGKVRAFFDLSTSDGFTIKGFKIIEGINGLFVSMPSQKGKNQQGEDEYYDSVWVESKTLREDLNKLAIDAYNGSQYMDTLNESVGNNMAEQPSPPESDKAPEKKEETKPFEDSDIPF